MAEGYGEQLAAEGEICWGGMHSWKRMVELLELVDRPNTVGFQADMAHTLLYTMGYNAPEDSILPQGYDWKDDSKLDEALKTLTDALRPWTIDFHVAQNNGTVHGSGTHDKTGRHCMANDPTGKLDIPQARRLLAAQRSRRTAQTPPPHLLGRVHVPQRSDDEAADVERHPRGDDPGAGEARVGRITTFAAEMFEFWIRKSPLARSDARARGISVATTP